MDIKERMANVGMTQVDMILELQKRGYAVQPPKTAMNDYTMEDIDPEQLINHYIRAEVVHTKVPSNKDPNKEVTFANLGDKSPADGFDTEPVARALTLGNGNNAAPKAAPKTQTASAPAKTGLDIDALLG